ncbi:MAG TPA: hypothetical protein VFI34_06845 [Candidatus Limnocylindrales bacterium]|nr:hypothetical protein [Candidatus Limnocylindrales bacterium]
MDRPPDPPPQAQLFLVERYWPEIDEASARILAGRLARTAHAMTAQGVAVAHVESILMPRDRVVFSLIVAADEASVRQLTARVGAPADRVALAIRLPDGDP